MSDHNHDSLDDDAMPSPRAPEGEKKPKRQIKRKPLWLALPIEFETIAETDGTYTRQPTRYELYECSSKKQVAAVIAKLGLDVTNLNPEHVKIFRADPIPLRLDTQVTLKF